jgi:hypothetical protein
MDTIFRVFSAAFARRHGAGPKDLHALRDDSYKHPEANGSDLVLPFERRSLPSRTVTPGHSVR